jgi:hypothetical protein
MMKKIGSFIKITNLLIILTFLIRIKADNKILITLKSAGDKFIYCDDIINYFGTSNMTVYRILEDQQINIDNDLFLKKGNDNDTCKNLVYYKTPTEYETLLIEFREFPKNLSGLFRESDINTIELENNQNDVSDYSKMFQDCKALTSVDLSKYNFYNAKKLNKMFSGCTNLQYFSLPKNTSLNEFKNCDFSEMFSDCTSLVSIDLSDIRFSGINNITKFFQIVQMLNQLL